MASAWAEPGQPLSGLTTSTLPGLDTHIFNSSIAASISGPVSKQTTSSKSAGSSKTKTTASVSIQRPHGAPLLPEVNNTVLARIIRLTPRSATCSILAIYPSPLTGQSASSSAAALLPAPPKDVTPVSIPAQAQFSGQIRAQDVRATEKDKVVMGEAFRVGDVVRAVVISLGDQRDYYLSTAGNEFGVLLAWSEGEGRLMEPVSWMEMRDPVSGRAERRKVAKPI